MAELRNVDPRALKPSPHNPRLTPPPAAMDEQLLASIKAIGIIQPPKVYEKDGELVIKAGTRRIKAAIAVELERIDVIVDDGDETNDPMESLSENLIRASMNSVDIWRGIDALEQNGWNEPAIADALALPVRTIKRLKLLAHLHPPMLDVMAAGNMPSEDQLHTIAAASRDKPKKGHDVTWYEIGRALARRRIPFSAAKFGDDLARAYGVVWEDDLFAPADEDGRYTTNVDGFFGAQQEWLQNNLPERGTLLPLDEYGRPQLPKKAEHVYSKPGKSDVIGHYLDPYSGDVKTIAYRLPDNKKPAKGDKNAATAPDPEAPQPRARPDVTQKGLAMIGDFRTDALHRALREAPLDSETLLALLVVAFAGANVDVRSPSPPRNRGIADRRRRAHRRHPRHRQGGARDARRSPLLPRERQQERRRGNPRRRRDRRGRLSAEFRYRGIPTLPIAEPGRAGRDRGRPARPPQAARHPSGTAQPVQRQTLRPAARPLRTQRI